MERFKNILFVSSGGKEDTAALDRANRLAKSNGARITLIRCVEELPMAAKYFLPASRLSEFKQASLSKACKDLDNLSKKIDPSTQVKTKVIFGKPFIEIIRAVQADSHDLIIKPKQSGLKEKELESTDLHLLRKCPCPIWIIKPSQRKPFGKILIAIDPDPSDPERLSLHKDILKLGISLAKIENSKIEIVHAWVLDGETMLRGPRFKMSEKEIQTLADEVQTIRQKWLHELLIPYDSTEFKITMIKGEPGPSLENLIEKRKPDLVVMGTVARTGLPGLLIGNTAEFVLRRIGCSVLTLKPRRFKTPVE